MAALHRDPVCGMDVAGAESELIFTYEGEEFHFCSTSCRDRFGAEPKKYLRGKLSKIPPGHVLQ